MSAPIAAYEDVKPARASKAKIKIRKDNGWISVLALRHQVKQARAVLDDIDFAAAEIEERLQPKKAKRR